MRLVVPFIMYLALFATSDALAGDAAAGEARFKQLCAACHGTTGKGDGPAAAAMNPKPRNFADPEWQKSVTDDYLLKVIRQGGSAVGKSPMMTPFGHSLNESQTQDVIAYIRGLK